MRQHAESRTVTVDKAQLLAKLHENREKHGAEYEETVAGYWKKVEERLAKLVERAKARDGGVRLVVDLQRPENHTEDYDLAIEALEWEVNEQVTITLGDFRRYVQDRWEWMDNFKHLNSTYSR